MDNQVTPIRHTFRYNSFQINKSQQLGRGAYGAVYEAKCDQLPCAAKVLHPTILDPMDPGADKIMERFSQECALLESIRHPNIVQYLAMTVDPESRLPVLLMELLDESLTKLLECSQRSLAYYIQVDICHDIALAITYLHSNNIIHRDLSSNNVLIIAKRRAKVTDFGMSKLSDAAPTMTPLTMCPGTLAYMPPEALREPPRYTKKLDCFSEGVIMVQVCTRLWPEPGPRTQTVKDSRSPMGIIEMPVSETERRKNHIDMIDPGHPLLPIAMDCLCFQELERPSSDELCQRLADLKEFPQYTQNIEQQQDEIQAKDDQITVLTQQLHESAGIIHEKQEEIMLKQSEIDEKNLQQNLEQTTSQERQLSQQLKEQEQVTAEIQQTNHCLQRQVEELKQQLSQQKQAPPASSNIQEIGLQEGQSMKSKLPKQLSLNVDQILQSPNTMALTLNWRDGGQAPFDMGRGAAVVDGEVAYFVGFNGQCCSYNSINKMWRTLPECPYMWCSLAIVNHQLTAIGGRKIDVFNLLNRGETNKLFTFHENENWNEIFPPMPTKRRSVAVISSEHYLIVAGGEIGLITSSMIVQTAVEVMDTKTLVWSTVASLPHPYGWASATICGDQLYMLGGLDDKDKTKSVLTCSLRELLQSSSSSSSSSSVWRRVTDTPAYLSTCTTVNGELLAVGGCDEDTKAISFIHKFNPTTNSWDHISGTSIARHSCLVVVLPTNEMMVVGGSNQVDQNSSAICEIASFIIL